MELELALFSAFHFHFRTGWSELHFFEVTFYKIHILTKGHVVVVEQSVYFHIFVFNGTVIVSSLSGGLNV